MPFFGVAVQVPRKLLHPFLVSFVFMSEAHRAQIHMENPEMPAAILRYPQPANLASRADEYGSLVSCVVMTAYKLFQILSK